MSDDAKEADGIDQAVQIQAKTHDDYMARKLIFAQDLNDPLTLVERVYHLWWNWADFHLYVVSPYIESIRPPILIEPEQLSDDEYEFVYNIYDEGAKLSTSKSEDMYSAGKSMCKFYFTIEKMLNLLVERLKSGGVDGQTEVQVAFGGHLLGQRKAFESIINLTSFNLVVTNFDPGEWGEGYLRNAKVIAEAGFGFPTESPRQPYKQMHKTPQSDGLRK